jgi:hypothetical protein
MERRMRNSSSLLALLVVFVLCASCVAELGSGEDADGETNLVASGLRASRVALDFDVFGYRCPGGATCSPEPDKCICQNEYDHLNATRVLADGTAVGHYVVTGSDSRRDQITRQGNRLAVNINELNAEWEAGGIARADAMMAWARRNFPDGVPQWFFLNEISRSRWLDGGDRGVRYRRFVADVARRLSVHHGRTVVVFAPFYRPGWSGTQHYPASWRALAANAYIGIENYIGGRLIRDAGFSEAFCRNRYQQSITAYTRMGVPLSRLILTEHFGQTTPDRNWGRGGLPIDQWIRAINVRTRAARSLPFAGYATYGWGSNRDHRPSAERRRAMDAYRRVGARRLALPDHGPAAGGEDARFDPSTDAEPEPSAEADRDESGDADVPVPLPPGDEPPPSDPAADDPTGGCDPPHSVEVGGRCVPSCGHAGGNMCSTGTDGACDGLASIESYDCPICCFRDPSAPPPPPPPPMCVPPPCGAGYLDACGGAPDGCGGTLSCGDTCGAGLNCNGNGVCKKALAQPCAGPGQCASGLCQWTTSPGSAARCCHDVGGWCDSDLKCCGGSVCRAGRCVTP